MRINDYVVKLDCTTGAYAYAVQDNGITLIDTGFPGKGKAILGELAAYGMQSNDIKRIFLTHGDTDHIGSAAYISETAGCDVFIGAGDLPYVWGKQPYSGVKRIMSIFMKPTLPKLLNPFLDARIEGFEIIPTPGHTPGHVCIRYKDVLFVGDMISGGHGRLSPSPAVFTWDKKKVLDSCKNLNIDGIKWICPAHGEPVEAQNAWKAYKQKYLI